MTAKQNSRCRHYRFFSALRTLSHRLIIYINLGNISSMETLLLPIFYIVVLLYSVVIHEVSHGLMADSLGDPTAKNLGRLTLNPLKHLDMFGSVLLPLLLLMIRSPFIIGYAKPVPYNPHNLNDKKYGPAKVNALKVFLYRYSLPLLFVFLIFIFPLIFPLVSILYRLITGIKL